MAAENVLGAPISSVYPNLGPALYKKAMGKRLAPRASEMRLSKEYTVMWSSTRSPDDMNTTYWVANHVSPMLPLYQPAQVYCD